MQLRGNTLKLTAVSALVVLTLTGFSTGRGHGGSSGGDGGGCSSSSQNHDSSTSGGGSHRDDDYDSDPDYGDSDSGTGGGGSGPDAGSSSSLQDGTVKLLSCATKTSPHATVEVTNPNARTATFSVTLHFRDGQGRLIAPVTEDVEVPGADSATVQVGLGGRNAAKVTRCDLTPTAPVTP